MNGLPPETSTTISPWDLADEAIAQVRLWLEQAKKYRAEPAAEHLASVLKNPEGLQFTVGFIDRVIRPEDRIAAAKALHHIGPRTPAFLPPHLRAALRAGAAVAPYTPRIVVPVAEHALRTMVDHLIVDAREHKLGKAIAQLKKNGASLNINLLGEAVLGKEEAARRVQATQSLIRRHDVDYVSIKVSSTVAPHNHWAFNEAVDDIIVHLRPLFRAAKNATPQTFINLDMEAYQDLDLTLEVFQRLMNEEEFLDYKAGIVLQAYLPDALQALMDLQEFASHRLRRRGAPIKVRVVKGANLPMERVQAQIQGWKQTVWPTKQESDTHYKALLNYALTTDRLRSVHLGVAGHNLFDVALAWTLIQARKIDAATHVDFEMLCGMATAQAQAVQEDVGRLLLYTPVVHPKEFDVAISYLVRRLEENASSDNFMSAVFELDRNTDLFEREAARFKASLHALKENSTHKDAVPGPRRTQNRAQENHEAITEVQPFWNEPDTDPNLAPNRAWGRAIIERIERSTLGEPTIQRAQLDSVDQLQNVFETAKKSARSWQKLSAHARARVLFRAADHLAADRARLLEVMASDTGKTLDQGDPEVSEAIDFCRYYANLALDLDKIQGAEHEPVDVTVVTPPWNFPVAIPCGSVAAALAAGSAVILKPASLAARCSAVMVQCLWAAMDDLDISRDILQLIQVGERSLGKALISDPRVDRVILTGGYETAQKFREFRADLPLLAETSGKNAIIVTPSADLDLAPADVAYSAFGHAGQKCSAASLVILVGSMAESRRFRRQLLDAVSSMHVGWPSDPRTQIGPVIEPPREKLHRGLNTLGEGERWLLKPQSLDASGRLYSPGIRVGVRPGSEYHRTEYFGPILGIMTARTLQEAVSYVNQVDYGLTSGIHSLDADEIRYWVEHIQAGNLYINRGITGAIVQRQPFGGWKRSAIGAGAKAGGPNYLIGLSRWRDAALSKETGRSDSSPVAGIARRLQALGVLGARDRWLCSAIAQDAQDVHRFLGLRDPSALEVEINALRYRPAPVTLRAVDDHSETLAQVARVILAGIRVHQAVHTGEGTASHESIALSLPPEAPRVFVDVMRDAGVQVVSEDVDAWALRVQRIAQATPLAFGRIRIVGEAREETVQATFAAMQGRPDVAVYAGDVTSAGRIEMLPFVREQAISMTAHRFGTLSDLPKRVFVDIVRGRAAFP